MPMTSCVVCNRKVYAGDGQLNICLDCEICPECVSPRSFPGASEDSGFMCEWCNHVFKNREELEDEMYNYWVERAKAILNITD